VEEGEVPEVWYGLMVQPLRWCLHTITAIYHGTNNSHACIYLLCVCVCCALVQAAAGANGSGATPAPAAAAASDVPALEHASGAASAAAVPPAQSPTSSPPPELPTLVEAKEIGFTLTSAPAKRYACTQRSRSLFNITERCVSPGGLLNAAGLDHRSSPDCLPN